MRSFTKLLAVVVVLVVAVALTRAVVGDDETLVVVAPTAERADVDAGDPGPSLGDERLFAGPLLDGAGERSGRLDGRCVTTSVEPEVRRQCSVTATLGTEDGETELQLQAVARDGAQEVVYSVVGGSGEYRGAEGQARFDSSERARTKIEVRLEG